MTNDPEEAPNNPWDRPPFPKRGNRSATALYASIGRALMAWEEVETMLAHLYAALCEKSLLDEKANHIYGEPSNFSSRLDGVERVGQRYFTKRPSQNLEARLEELVRIARGYSGRRNDIAHGVIRLIHMILDPHATLLGGPGAPAWCVVPQHFREAKFLTPNMPVHVLTSREIRKIAGGFWSTMRRAHALGEEVELPRYRAARQAAVPPFRGSAILTAKPY